MPIIVKDFLVLNARPGMYIQINRGDPIKLRDFINSYDYKAFYADREFYKFDTKLFMDCFGIDHPCLILFL